MLPNPPDHDAAELAARALRDTSHSIARALSELDAAADARVAEAETRLTASLAREARICTALQERLFELEHALRDADERRAAEAGAFADQAAKRHAEFTASLTHTLQARDVLAAELAAATAALDAAQDGRRADAAAAAEHLRLREAELGAALADADRTRAALEDALSALEGEHRDACARAESDLAAAMERQAALDDLLAQESDRRTGLDQKLASVEAALEDAAHRHTAELARAAARLADVQAGFDAAVVAATTREAELVDRLKTEQTTRAIVERLLAGLRAEAARERSEHDVLRQAFSAMEDRFRQFQRASGDERQAQEQAFDRLQTAFQSLEAIAGEHAAERARLEGVVAARDGELSAQAQRHRAAEQAAQDAFAHAETNLREALAAKSAEVVRMQHESDALRKALEAARTEANTFRRDAQRAPALQADLELVQKERRRDFERSPYGLCLCTPAGVITDANHSFVSMLGLRRVDELRNLDFTTALFDCAGDLGWLLERTRGRRRTESVETNWKTRDGRELVVRVQASATTTGSVEIVAEDITRMRALEERLGRAQRMEAVGRLASEVAVTCDAMLGDVARGVQEWAATINGADALRQGDRLLTDVRRAASHLRQLGVYGAQQVRALAPVNVQRVLTDIAPVLKRVVGDQISLELSKSSRSFDVDVDAERLERVLINVASYARQRMPDGGQMRIDLATTALGRRFVTRYPSVRPGHHVLITVTELPRIFGSRDTTDREERRSDRTEVELGALADLVGTCGGHLWLEAQPAGNLVVKMYLPRRTAADASESSEPAPRSLRAGRLAKWFRATPAIRMRA